MLDTGAVKGRGQRREERVELNPSFVFRRQDALKAPSDQKFDLLWFL